MTTINNIVREYNLIVDSSALLDKETSAFVRSAKFIKCITDENKKIMVTRATRRKVNAAYAETSDRIAKASIFWMDAAGMKGHTAYFDGTPDDELKTIMSLVQHMQSKDRKVCIITTNDELLEQIRSEDFYNFVGLRCLDLAKEDIHLIRPKAIA